MRWNLGFQCNQLSTDLQRSWYHATDPQLEMDDVLCLDLHRPHFRSFARKMQHSEVAVSLSKTGKMLFSFGCVEFVPVNSIRSNATCCFLEKLCIVSSLISQNILKLKTKYLSFAREISNSCARCFTVVSCCLICLSTRKITFCVVDTLWLCCHIAQHLSWLCVSGVNVILVYNAWSESNGWTV